MQINQSSYSPGNFPNRSAGRNLPSSRSVCGKRNTTICPTCFTKKLLLYRKDCTKQTHLPYRASPKPTIKKSNLVSLVVRLSCVSIPHSQAILPAKNAAISVRIEGFFHQLS